MDRVLSGSHPFVFSFTQVSSSNSLNNFCTVRGIFLVFLRRKKGAATTEKGRCV